MKYQREELLKALQNPKELKRLRNTTHHKADKNPGDNDVEKALADWLGRLKLLHGLPFNYLVPDTKMLPEESLRFFYFNTLWLDYLQEGALSLGRSTSSMKVHDQAFASDLDYLSRWGMRKQRSKVLGHLVHHLHPDELKALNADPIPVNEKVTGFLLRSGVVSGWEGLQIEAFHDLPRQRPLFLTAELGRALLDRLARLAAQFLAAVLDRLDALVELVRAHHRHGQRHDRGEHHDRGDRRPQEAGIGDEFGNVVHGPLVSA